MNKPTRPITVIPLALVAAAGLVAQFLAAVTAFDLITDNHWQAVGAALVIEGATVVEALVFIRSRNGYAGLGLLVTMLSSGIYNFTQADKAGADLGLPQLIAMSVGPLGALVSVGLALGDELRKYESALVEWQAIQAELAQDAADLLRRETIKSEREAQEEKRWQRQLEQQRFAGELERQAQLQATQLKEKGLALRRAEKAARQSEKQNDNGAPQSASGAQTAPRWRDWAHFRDDASKPDDLTTSQVMELAQVSKRTAQRWNKDDRDLIAARSDNGRE